MMANHRPARFLGLTALALSAVTLRAVPAVAGPFSGADTFTGKSLVPDTGEPRFIAGANLQVAPVQAIIQSVVRSEVAKYSAEHPEAAGMTDYVQYVDPKEAKAAADSGKLDAYKAKLKADMAAQGQTPTPEQSAAIDQMDADKLRTLATVAEFYGSSEPTTAFSLEPYAGFVAGPVRVLAQVPLAGFYSASSTTMVIGNPGLDAEVGHHFGATGASLGLAAGVSGWAPLGSADADTIVLSNVLASPRYLHEYASWTGYGVLGAELGFVNLTAHGEFVEMRPVSDRNKDANPLNNLHIVRYATAGATLAADLGLIGLSAAVDSVFNIKNAKSIDKTVLVTMGLRVFLRKVRLGAAVQMPVAKPGEGGPVSVGGVALGAPASINVLFNAQLNL